MAYKVLICSARSNSLIGTLETCLKQRNVIVRVAQTDAVMDDEVVVRINEDESITVTEPGASEPVTYDRSVDVIRIADDIAVMVATTPEEHLLARLSVAGLNVGAGLRYTANDGGLFLEVVRSFTSDATARLDHFRTYYAQQDWKNYGVQAHSLKSSARTIGADTLADLALDQELAAKESRVADIMRGNDTLLETYERTVANIRAELSSEGSEAGDGAEAIEAEGLRQTLNTCLSHLEVFEVERARRLLDGVFDRSFHGQRVEDMLRPATESLENFDAEGAASELRALLDSIA